MIINTNNKVRNVVEMPLSTMRSLMQNRQCEYHHCAYQRGYVSRKHECYVESCNGRYGVGYIIHQPAFHTTMYHYISYYISNQENAESEA